MKITGSNSYIKFDLETGYVIKGEGERLAGGKFVVYKNSMKSWESPHENEEINSEQILEIIEQVKKSVNENTVQIVFE